MPVLENEDADRRAAGAIFEMEADREKYRIQHGDLDRCMESVRQRVRERKLDIGRYYRNIGAVMSLGGERTELREESFSRNAFVVLGYLTKSGELDSYKA